METVDRIRTIINQSFSDEDDPLVVGPDDDLLSVLDSLQVLRMVVDLEKMFSIKIGNSEITPDNFRSLATLAGFVDRKAQSNAMAS
jgi:acyl carrier protein